MQAEKDQKSHDSIPGKNFYSTSMYLIKSQYRSFSLWEWRKNFASRERGTISEPFSIQLSKRKLHLAY